MTDNDDFFEGKRPWSIIKDQVLQDYMSPYLSKVKNLKKPIVLFDGYAGPGVFEDKKPGSPLIMCQAAEKAAPGNYQAFFVNKEEKYHKKLDGILRQGGWHGPAQPVHGDTTKILPTLPNQLRDHTVFLYLDPFGPTGSQFSLVEPFLKRNVNYSTEMVIMMHMPVLHRLAARHAVEAGREDEIMIRKMHERLSLTLGGAYWKPIMWDTSPMTTDEREKRLIDAYVAKLNSYLPYAGCCPVREGPRDRTKYFIVFVSRHPDAMVLMNDAMIKAYFMRMNEDEWGGTLFADTSWTEWLSTDGLPEVIIDQVRKSPGSSREDIWTEIVRQNFMKYRKPDYGAAVNELVANNVIYSPTMRRFPTRLNDNCTLFMR